MRDVSISNRDRAWLGAFVIAAIVFVPGSADGGDDALGRPGEVAARMLAPAFEASDVAGYQRERPADQADEHGVTQANDFVVAFVILLVTVGLSKMRVTRLYLSSTPIADELIASPNRDRGPPHLQFA